MDTIKPRKLAKTYTHSVTNVNNSLGYKIL